MSNMSLVKTILFFVLWNATLALNVDEAGILQRYGAHKAWWIPTLRTDVHPCSRVCQEGAAPMTCRYNFTVESYHTLSKACFDCPFNQTDCLRPDCIPGNGLNRSLTVINRQLPGPSVQVCENDNIVIKVKNLILGESTSIHWHGMHQVDTPHHDGVPMVTQCPIASGNSFTYIFTASPAGTHFYHSHTALQRADGVYGAFIVRQPLSEDPHGTLYDYDLPEHVIIVSDYFYKMARDKFTAHNHGFERNKPASALINGRGEFQSFTRQPDFPDEIYTPREIFHVEAGKRYRMRVISNAALSCPIQFSVDHHNLSMIASDGKPFEPFEVESFVINAGERYDFILNAAVTAAGNHWIRVHGLDDCVENEVHQEAILRYSGAEDLDPDEETVYGSGAREGMQLNPLDSGFAENKVPLAEMEYSYPNEDGSEQEWAKPEADSKYYMDFDFSMVNNPHFNDPDLYPIDPNGNQPVFTPQINYKSLMFPPSPPLTQYNDIPQDLFCESNEVITDSRCNETYCECLQIVKIPLGDVAEIFLIDRGVFPGATHPFHLHGYSVRVVAYDKTNENITVDDIKEMDRNGEIIRNLNKTAQKDTISVPSGGYAVLRFKANNPGFWLLHCHIDFHLDLGMGLIVQVGEVSQMTSAPLNFPKCGDWEFEGYVSDGQHKRPCCFVYVFLTLWMVIKAELN